ncbi:MBL fold metallo-hydrolase [Clostridium baratii]|uniref:MBL fold metallo-hydrolase n=1 Tax=Clostridium baratii TaxID=1561 RepID=UPI00242F8A9A|nr:MBL fold metallo-hydrolase [Clostridium baratii]MBS6043737.1 MBL fold metallo-hydrolase [Clostridium baratii]
MTLTKITERVYFLANNQETDRPLLGYIKGDHYSLMIDGGNSKKHIEKFNHSLKKYNLKLPDYAAITHFHWDHTYGMHAIKGQTIACQTTNEKLKIMSNWEWSDDAMKKRLLTGEDIEFADTNIRKEYQSLQDIKVVTADIIFNNELTLNLGGIDVILKKVIAPHSEDSVIVYVPQEKVVFIGDAYSKDYYDNCNYDPIKIKSFANTLENLEFNTCFLGHSKPLKKKEIVRFLNSQYEQIMKDNKS